MDGKPPFPNQKLLDTPKQLINKVTSSDFFDFDKTSSPTIHKLFGLGILILVVAIGLYILVPMAAKIADGQKDLIQGYVPVSTSPKSMKIELQNPDDELLVFDKTVVVSGKTSPKAAIVITNGQSHVGTDADTGGHFQKVVDLTPGVNQIIVQAYDTEGNTKSDSRMVYYSEEKL